jgi:guanosine-3',5'-bis(diphosphate) 3'-pyrophosphohydrolase
VEDTDLTLDDVKDLFGPTVATIIDGLTKISGVQFSHGQHAGGELPQGAAHPGAGRARDPDQAGRPPAQHAHPGQHAARQAAEDRQRNALPLRAPGTPLGLYAIKSELEDLALKFKEPGIYRDQPER